MNNTTTQSTRPMNGADVRDIARGVCKRYDGPGYPSIEVCQHYRVVDGRDETWFDCALGHEPRGLFDTFFLIDAVEMSSAGFEQLQVRDGFTVELLIHEPDIDDVGEYWGTLRARWSGSEWTVYDPQHETIVRD